ncbi:hypothetical protein CFIO01_11716 [Colletotrichum fioriniae PJ7]|uniref:Uncharacterized protein n=1 Tax=Colletotrichum fioriniae PJ7 TaxID=1445577 RepID=A0A010S1M5_9PEZI|nr:hypothetical protein CFIO01_11716 [Colletotrichum fioriniae PJ7]
MASNGSRGIDANDKDDQERFDIVLAPYRKNRRLLRVKSLPFAETRVRVEAFLKSKLAKPDSASFNWPPSSRPSGHDGVVFLSFRERNDCVRADRDLKEVMYPGPRGPRELIVQLDRDRTLNLPAAIGNNTLNANAFAGTVATSRPQLSLPAPPSPGTTAYTAAPMLPFVSAERFRLGTMERLQAFLRDEMRATTDGDRMRMSEAFFFNEIRIRRERNGNAGAGAPSDAASQSWW